MQKYGASIPTELFGSEFFMGRLMKRIPEPEMCYMLGDSQDHSAPVLARPALDEQNDRENLVPVMLALVHLELLNFLDLPYHSLEPTSRLTFLIFLKPIRPRETSVKRP